MSGPNSTVIQLLTTYIALVQGFFEHIFRPVSDFFSSYSPSLGESIMTLSRILSNTVILSPVFLSSVAIGSVIFGFDFSNVGLSRNVGRYFVSTIMLVSSVSLFTVSRSRDDSLNKSVYIFLLLAFGGISVLYFSSPEIYAVLVAIFYGLGGFNISKIDHVNPLPHEHIYNNLQPQEKIKRVSVTLLIVVSLVYIAIWYMRVEGVDQQIVVVTGFILPVLSVISISLLSGSYEDIYEHANLKKKSQIWTLTPKLMVIISFGVYIANRSLSPITVLAFASPGILGLIFTYYIVSQIETVFGSEAFTDSDMLSHPSAVSTNQTINIAQNVNKENQTARFDIDMDIRISKEIPKDNINPWIEILIVSEQILRSTETIHRVDKTKIEEIESFQEQCAEILTNRMSDNNINWGEVPEEILNILIRYRTQNDKMSVQDIIDAEIKSDNKQADQSYSYMNLQK